MYTTQFSSNLFWPWYLSEALFRAAIPCLRMFQGVLLQLSNNGSDLAGGLSSDIEELPEFVIGGPAQVSKFAVTGGDQRPHNHRTQPEAMAGQGIQVVQSDVHPRGALRDAT